MSSQSKTEYLKLSQYENDDIPQWRTDYTGDMAIIDKAIKDLTDISEELKKCVSDRNTKIATAITDMGVATEPTDSADVMAENIRKISSGSSVEAGVMQYTSFINSVDITSMATSQIAELLHMSYNEQDNILYKGNNSQTGIQVRRSGTNNNYSRVYAYAKGIQLTGVGGTMAGNDDTAGNIYYVANDNGCAFGLDTEKPTVEWGWCKGKKADGSETYLYFTVDVYNANILILSEDGDYEELSGYTFTESSTMASLAPVISTTMQIVANNIFYDVYGDDTEGVKEFMLNNNQYIEMKKGQNSSGFMVYKV